jgi:hypothetical protein
VTSGQRSHRIVETTNNKHCPGFTTKLGNFFNIGLGWWIMRELIRAFGIAVQWFCWALAAYVLFSTVVTP